MQAFQQVVQCRRVLKWTYAYGYYAFAHERDSVDTTDMSAAELKALDQKCVLSTVSNVVSDSDFCSFADSVSNLTCKV